MRKPELTYHWRLLDGVTALKDGSVNEARLLPGRNPVRRELISNIPEQVLDRFDVGWNENRTAQDPDQEADWLATLDWLNLLKGLGLIRVEIYGGSKRLMTLIPHDRKFDLPQVACVTAGLRAKPFLYARPCADGLSLNEPDVPVTAILHCADLRRVVTSGQRLPLEDIDASTIELCGLLAALGYFQSEGAHDQLSHTWEFHDRLLLSQIRTPDRINALGATYRFGSKNPGVESPELDGDYIALPEPGLSDHTFGEVLRNRRSRRHIGAQPVNLNRLSDLLGQAWRDVDLDDDFPRTRRPFPSGGGIHELDVTVFAPNVEGLTPGAYRYCSRAHRLYPIDVDQCVIDDLCAQVRATPGATGADLGCLLIVRSRFPELARVYEKIAMKLTLMNAGAALQTLQLVATDLGLNSWIIGAGMDFEMPDENTFSIAGFAIGEAS